MSIFEVFKGFNSQNSDLNSLPGKFAHFTKLQPILKISLEIAKKKIQIFCT